MKNNKNQIHLTTINKKLSCEFLIKNRDILNWELVTIYQDSYMEAFSYFADYINYDLLIIFKNEILEHNFVIKYINRMNEWLLMRYDVISLDDIILYKDNVSDDFIDVYIDKINWCIIIFYENLKKEKIIKYVKYFDVTLLGLLLFYIKFSPEFLDELMDEIFKYKYTDKELNTIFIDIILYQKVSEDFIYKYQDYVDWYLVSKRQILSEEFIYEFRDKVNWDMIFIFQCDNMSDEFKRLNWFRKYINPSSCFSHFGRKKIKKVYQPIYISDEPTTFMTKRDKMILEGLIDGKPSI